MSVHPLAAKTPLVRLEPFAPAGAGLVASWVLDAQEAYWLAPKTKPPLTAQQILQWRLPNHEPLQLWDIVQQKPVAYGELNVLNRASSQYWLGHLIVDPAQRGRGVGKALTRLLLQRAFTHYAARRVSLVVFPENQAAIRCYTSAGMRESGHEEHDLPAYGRRASLLRLSTNSPH